MAKVKEQNIAVFGESGSGKTVLLSSFYGATQEPTVLKESLYKVVADDTGQGNLLRQNYLRMSNDARAPQTNRFTAVPYSFTIKPHAENGAYLPEVLDAKQQRTKVTNLLGRMRKDGSIRNAGSQQQPRWELA